ncbi:hypothetical protein MC885_009172 [Smutsia gigantea]|nr:hypothetical protein MC885_009172 [Smutsia gigantea]
MLLRINQRDCSEPSAECGANTQMLGEQDAAAGRTCLPLPLGPPIITQYEHSAPQKRRPRQKEKQMVATSERVVTEHDPGALSFCLVKGPGTQAARIECCRETQVSGGEHDTALCQRSVRLGLQPSNQSAFTAGPDELHAQARRDTDAPHLQGKVMDFEEAFVMAEVMKYADFKEEGSENAIKLAGKPDSKAEIKMEIFIKFNTPRQLKKK